MNNADRFWAAMAAVREVFDAGARQNLAFWLAIWNGEQARERVFRAEADQSDARMVFAFELGLQLSAELQAAGKAVVSALVTAGVSALLGGLKPR